jgi:predicted regulator of Ras-like GTPase activity (Roadblock/LC7/MglB family)
MTRVPDHQQPELVAHGYEVLREMKELCRSLVYATILTDDGFEVVRITDATMEVAAEDDRFASMASSIQALSDAVARELQIGSSDYVIIASASGHVVQRRVPGHPLVMAALFDDDETLGKALSISRRSAELMAAYLAPLPN